MPAYGYPKQRKQHKLVRVLRKDYEVHTSTSGPEAMQTGPLNATQLSGIWTSLLAT